MYFSVLCPKLDDKRRRDCKCCQNPEVQGMRLKLSERDCRN